MTAQRLKPGSRLGAFVIESHIAAGGMGVVYAARNIVTGDERALKVILPELDQDPEVVQRFIREIRNTMAIEHLNLVQVFEPGMDGDVLFLPMELLHGETLAEHLARESRMPPATAIEVLEGVGAAVHALHVAGVVHRDLKPSNIFFAVQPDGGVVPKVIDLGVARRAVLSDELTSSGAPVGSQHYMSPEQACGTRDAVHPLSDQYALGVVLYEMLTGARPYEDDGDGHAIAKLIAGKPFRAPRELVPELPEALEVALLRALEYEPDARFANVEEMVRALRASLDRSSRPELPTPRRPPILHTVRMGPPDPPPSKPQIDTVPIPSSVQHIRAPMRTRDPDSAHTPLPETVRPRSVSRPSRAAYALAAFGPAALVFAIFALWPRDVPTTTADPPEEPPASVAAPSPAVDAITGAASPLSLGTGAPSVALPRVDAPHASSQPLGAAPSPASSAARSRPGAPLPCVSRPGAPCL